MNQEKRLAFVFPGQGSQSVGMLAGLSERYPIVRATFDEASAIVGFDLWELAQSGPKEKIDQTEITQPLLLAADVAVYRCWQSIADHARPTVLAGHSLGEYASLVVSGALTFSDAVFLVMKRSQYMQAAVPAGFGAMGAIVGLDNETIMRICIDAAEGDVLAPANFNSIGQTVIAGVAVAVERALVLAKTAGAKIAKLIPVSVPSHCPLMQSAADQLALDLNQIQFGVPMWPTLHNEDVCSHPDPCGLRKALTNQLVLPVCWVRTIQVMIATFGVTTFVECGPGKVLAGLIKRINADIPVVSAVDVLMGDHECAMNIKK